MSRGAILKAGLCVQSTAPCAHVSHHPYPAPRVDDFDYVPISMMYVIVIRHSPNHSFIYNHRMPVLSRQLLTGDGIRSRRSDTGHRTPILKARQSTRYRRFILHHRDTGTLARVCAYAHDRLVAAAAAAPRHIVGMYQGTKRAYACRR